MFVLYSMQNLHVSCVPVRHKTEIDRNPVSDRENYFRALNDLMEVCDVVKYPGGRAHVLQNNKHA